MNILVIEDDQAIRDMICLSLSQANYYTSGCVDVKCAKKSIAEIKPDCLVVDWMLPDSSGIELIDEGSTSTQYAKLEHLGNLVSKMLKNALNAFARLDGDIALKTIKKDKKVNVEFESLMRQLITLMMEDPRSIKNALRVSWCARALERVGDHAINICEYVLYLKHGKDFRHIDYKEVKKQLSR